MQEHMKKKKFEIVKYMEEKGITIQEYKVFLQYCAKVMQAKCVNFVLCSCDFSMKVRSNVRMKFYGVSCDNSLQQRAIFLQSFVQLKKICEHKW